jgi:hypothetical protein
LWAPVCLEVARTEPQPVRCDTTSARFARGEHGHGLAFPGGVLHARRSQGGAWGDPPMFGPASDYQSEAGLFNDKLTTRLRNKVF